MRRPIDKECKNPGYPDYGIVKVEKYGYIQRAVFHCKHGYDLVGKKVIKCKYDGTWSDRPPVCKRECASASSVCYGTSI